MNAPRLSPGTRIGPYEVRVALGAGGQGALVRARHVELESEVALKLLLDATPDQRKRFRQEAKVLAQLEHPHVVRVLGFDSENPIPYIAMELIEGGDLRARLGSGPLSPADIVEVLAPIARAVHYCHEKGLVHRDLKPANVIVEQSTGRPVLVDFGLVKRDPKRMGLTLDGGTRFSHSGEVKGTPIYMAPEQVDSDLGAVGPLTDVYGLGSTLYHLLTGAPPYDSKVGDYGVMLRLMRDPPPNPGALARDVPSALLTLCRRSMAKAQRERPQSAEEFALALEQAAGASGTATRTWRWPIAIGVLMLALATGATFVAPAKPTAAIDTQAKPPTPGELETAFDTKDRERMLQLCDDWLEIDPSAAEPWYWRGRSSCRVGDYMRAGSEFERCLLLDPDHRTARYFLAYCYRKQSRLEEAAQIYQALIAEGERVGDSYVSLAGTYQDMGNEDRARQTYRDGRAALRGPALLKLAGLERSRISATFSKKAEGQEASLDRDLSDLLGIANAIGGESAAERALRGHCYHLAGAVTKVRGRIQEAIGYYRRATQECPDQVLWVHPLAIAIATRRAPGDLDAAVELFSQVLRQEPAYVGSLNGRGNTYLIQKKFDLAERDFEEAARVDPERRRVYLRNSRLAKGRGHQRNGQMEAAAYAYVDSIHYPEDPKLCIDPFVDLLELARAEVVTGRGDSMRQPLTDALRRTDLPAQLRQRGQELLRQLGKR